MKNYLESINPTVLNYFDELKKIRRDLHQIPEAGLKEFKTQSYILDYLKNLGLEPEICKTGVILKLKGKGKTIALRADMDALPFKERTDLEFKSKNEGMMHACGHDGHMAMLLVLIKYLIEENIEHPNLVFLFQPAEEGPGGAKILVNNGYLDQVDEVYGFHIFPFLEEGKIGLKPGEMMAMTTEFYITIEGKASHAGRPNEGIDPIVAASSFILNLQTIKSRNLKPGVNTICHVGILRAGEALNAVASKVEIKGTIRSYQIDIQKEQKKRVEEILKGTDTAFGTKSELTFNDMYPPVINDKNLAKELEKKIENTIQFEPVMLAEDFAVYQQEVPGVFLGLGSRSNQYNSDLHSDTFDFDEHILLKGLDTYLKIITR